MSATGPVAGGVAALVTFACTPGVTALLARRGVLDASGERSSHTGSVPRGGGYAVLAGAATGCLSAWTVGWNRMAAGVLVGALLLSAIGALDDLRGGIGATSRLVCAALTGLAAATLVVDPASVTDVALVVIAAMWVVAFTNAFNFMDGINGIAGLHGVVFGLSSAYLGSQVGERPLMALGLCVAGSSVGFLPWNLSGRIFLGDVGSYAIGGGVALLFVALVKAGAPLVAGIGAALPYLADTGFTILRRWHAGESLVQPHRCHAYQHLSDVVGKHAPVALLVSFVSATSAVLTIWASTLAPPGRALASIGAISVSVLYAVAPRLLLPESDRSSPRVAPQNAEAS